MPLTRDDKAELLEIYEKGLATTPHAFLLGYQGIKVPQVTALREKVRQSGGEYIVVKNTLALRAIDGQALGQLKEHFTGPTAVAYGKDPVAIAKTLTDFAKEAPVLQFKAGLVEGRAIEGAQIKDIAALPSRNELIAKLLFLLQSPITGLARVLAAVPQSFVMVLDQVRQKKEGSGEATETTTETAEPAA